MDSVTICFFGKKSVWKVFQIWLGAQRTRPQDTLRIQDRQHAPHHDVFILREATTMEHVIGFVICVAIALGSVALGLGSFIIGAPETAHGDRQGRQSR